MEITIEIISIDFNRSLGHLSGMITGKLPCELTGEPFTYIFKKLCPSTSVTNFVKCML